MALPPAIEALLATLTPDEIDAITNANSPSAGNPFATIAEVPTVITQLDGISSISPVTGNFLRYDGIGDYVNTFITDADIPDSAITQHNLEISHSLLNPVSLGNDDHVQYTRVDGTRPFTGTIAGVDPLTSADLTTKAYVDTLQLGLIPKENVVALSDSNVTLTGIQLVDLHNPKAGDRIALTGQTDPIENGLWEMQPGAWTRPSDFPAAGAAERVSVYVVNGKVYAGSRFVVVTPAGSDTIDTDPLTLTQHSGALTVSAGRGMRLVGNRFDILGGNAITVHDNSISVQDGEIDHGSLNPLSLQDDDHPLYVPRDGRRGFTAPVSGQAPTDATHLITLSYLNSVIGGAGTLTQDEIDAIQGSTLPSAANVFITQTALFDAVSQDQQDALDAATSPSAVNAYATIADLSAGSSVTREDLICLASVAVNDFVYISASGTAAKAGYDVHEAEGVVIEKPTATSCKVEFGTTGIVGLTGLGFAATDRIFLAASTGTPNMTNVPPASGVVQQLGSMVSSDKLRTFIRTEFVL
jgi:hypothetical protein